MMQIGWKWLVAASSCAALVIGTTTALIFNHSHGNQNSSSAQWVQTTKTPLPVQKIAVGSQYTTTQSVPTPIVLSSSAPKPPSATPFTKRAAKPAVHASTYTAPSAWNIIRYAESYLGTRYTWGGESVATGFDCSGLVQVAFRHYGIPLGRTTWDQINEGRPIPEWALEPGDLVFFSSDGPGPTHVGIYVGDGLMVDAEEHGVVFDDIYSSYWSKYYYASRRVL